MLLFFTGQEETFLHIFCIIVYETMNEILPGKHFPMAHILVRVVLVEDACGSDA